MSLVINNFEEKEVENEKKQNIESANIELSDKPSTNLPITYTEPKLKELVFEKPSSKDEAINYFLKLEDAAEQAKIVLKEYENSVESLVEFVGIDKYFQSPKGDVYKVGLLEGKWVPFNRYNAKSTRAVWDPFNSKRKQRSLSLKEAREAGYDV